MGAKLSPFGKRIIGEEAARQQKEMVEKSAHIYGPRVTGYGAEKKAESHGAVRSQETPQGEATAPPASPETPNPLAGVDFASDQAAELAVKAALTAKDFEGKKGSAKSGGYSIQDVRDVIDAQFKEEEPKTEGEKQPSGDEGETTAATISVTDIKAALEESPTAVAEILEAELARPEGARIAALRMLREAEGQRPEQVGGPRAEVLEKVDAAISERLGQGV